MRGSRELSCGSRGSVGSCAILALQSEPRLADPAPREEVAQLRGLAHLAGLNERLTRAVDVVAELRDDGSVVQGVSVHQRDVETEGVAARGGELGLGEIQIAGADRGVGEAVMQGGREP